MLEAFHLTKSHSLRLPTADIAKTVYRSFNDFCLLLDKKSEGKDKKKAAKPKSTHH